MPRGGARVGAGRKPKSSLLKFIGGDAGRRGHVSEPTAARAPAPVEPPAWLLPGELVVWLELAPQARAERTLTPATAVSFAHFCQGVFDVRELRARLARRQPFLDQNELSLRREVRQLTAEVRSAAKDFKLAPFGKEIVVDEPEPADPLDAFTRRRE